MDLNQIETNLNSTDFQHKLQAIKALKEYSDEIAVPLLQKMKNDEQFLVRSFVAMGLGKKKTPESFITLLEMMKFDQDNNVRAEASNSLSLFGEISIPHLQKVFEEDKNWLVRLSILAALIDLNCPNEIFNACLLGINGEDESVKSNCINSLASLIGTTKEEEALQQLLIMANNSDWQIRVEVAKILTKFTQPQARQQIQKMQQDSDYRVVSAILETIIT